MRTIDWLMFVLIVLWLIFSVLLGWARRRAAARNADLLTPLIGARLKLEFLSDARPYFPILFTARGTFNGRQVFIQTYTPWSADKLRIYSVSITVSGYHLVRHAWWYRFFGHMIISDGNAYNIRGHELSCPVKVNFINNSKDKLAALKCHLEDLYKIADKLEGGEISEPFLLKDGS